MIILTQDGDIVNFDNITSISTFSGEIENEEVYCLLAISPDMSYDNENRDDIINNAIQLGVYQTIEECEKANQEIIKCIAENVKICKIPDPTDDVDADQSTIDDIADNG